MLRSVQTPVVLCSLRPICLQPPHLQCLPAQRAGSMQVMTEPRVTAKTPRSSRMQGKVAPLWKVPSTAAVRCTG